MASAQILMVEDEILVAETIQKTLTELGYRVPDAVASGEEAVARVAEIRPDLVLMDIKLKGEMDGIEAANQIRDRYGTPVVYLTAYADGETLQRAKVSAPLGYVLKPFKVQELHTAIEMALYKSEMDRKLKDSQGTLTALVESAPTGIVIINGDGRISLVNAVALAMFGYRKEDLMNQPVEFLLPERFREVHPVHRAGFLLDPQSRPMGTDLDLFGRRKDESEFPVEVGLSLVDTGTGLLVMSFFSDITERKRAEEQLRKLSRAVEQSPSTVVITDTSGRIEYVNPKFAEITGYQEEEVLDQNPRLLKSGEQASDYYEGLWTTVLDGGEWRGEFSNRRKDGSVYWESASISPIKNAKGEITHFVKVAEDITEHKRADAALREYAAQLVARNEELDAFAHTVAHDLKNPLNLMLAFAEILEMDLETTPDADARRYLSLIARSGRKMSNIIEELLLLAGVRKVDAPLAPIDMADVVSEAQHRIADMVAEHGADIVLPNAWPRALGYAPWVEEVWVNYLSNALKYGGRPPRVELGAEERADGMIRFWMRDNGQGLTLDDQAQLFAPFKQLDQTRAEGHGLGLSIVRRIVHKLGGEVGVESEGVPGQGSIFFFTLPVVSTEGQS